DDGSGPVTFSLPRNLWHTSRSGTLFKYKNASAPGGPSAVKIAKVKAGLLKVVAKDLPFSVPSGSATITVVLSLDGGTNRYSMSFSGTGDSRKFKVKNAPPPLPTPTFTPAPGVCPTPPSPIGGIPHTQTQIGGTCWYVTESGSCDQICAVMG